MIVANNPNSFLFNESTYQRQHQNVVAREGGWKEGTNPLQAPMGWENQTLERDNHLNTHINNRVKEVFIFRNRIEQSTFTLYSCFPNKLENIYLPQIRYPQWLFM